MSAGRWNRSRLASTVTTVLVVTTVAVAGAEPGAADTALLPPFSECPAIGQDTGCGLLIVINQDGTTTVLRDPAQPPIDGLEDTLVGVQNNSAQTVYMVPI